MNTLLNLFGLSSSVPADELNNIMLEEKKDIEEKKETKTTDESITQLIIDNYIPKMCTTGTQTDPEEPKEFVDLKRKISFSSTNEKLNISKISVSSNTISDKNEVSMIIENHVTLDFLKNNPSFNKLNNFVMSDEFAKLDKKNKGKVLEQRDIHFKNETRDEIKNFLEIEFLNKKNKNISEINFDTDLTFDPKEMYTLMQQQNKMIKKLIEENEKLQLELQNLKKDSKE